MSVEELRAAFRKQMSLPGGDVANQDTQLTDPMEKVIIFSGIRDKQYMCFFIRQLIQL